MDRLAIIGDVHGCSRSLRSLLKKLPTRDRILCVGDIIDRGPSCKEAFRIIREEGVECVLGNHEWLMLTGYDKTKPNHASWLANGGRDTLRDFKSEEDLAELIAFCKEMPYSMEFTGVLPKKIVLCHAGVKKGLTLKQSIDLLSSAKMNDFMASILWNRLPAHLAGTFMVYGHTPVDEPLLTADICNIDTGCVYRNKLSALLLPEMSVVQVPYQE